jgi:hypothetical protein
MKLMCLILLFGTLLIGIACSSSSSPNLGTQNEEYGKTRFEIHIFEFDNLNKLGPPEIVNAISENDPSVLNSYDLVKADVIITEEDILTYDWTIQEIVLNDSFRERYISEDTFLSDFSVFIVSFKGKPLFSGKILRTYSPLYLETPILYVSPPQGASAEDGLVVYLRPNSVVFQQGEDLETVFPIKDFFLAEQVRDHLRLSGKFGQSGYED